MCLTHLLSLVLQLRLTRPTAREPSIYFKFYFLGLKNQKSSGRDDPTERIHPVKSTSIYSYPVKSSLGSVIHRSNKLTNTVEPGIKLGSDTTNRSNPVESILDRANPVNSILDCANPFESSNSPGSSVSPNSVQVEI